MRTQHFGAVTGLAEQTALTNTLACSRGRLLGLPSFATSRTEGC